jgi:hypothetical protein
MSTWTTDDLRRVSDAVELRVASRRADGTLRPYVTIRHVGVGDALYIRSAHGPRTAGSGGHRSQASAGSAPAASSGT